MTDHDESSASGLDLNSVEWRKSTFSGHKEECVEVAAAPWRKSSLSGHREDCVEVAAAPEVVAVRDSKDRSGPVLTFAAAEWAAFVSGVRAGEFDL